MDAHYHKVMKAREEAAKSGPRLYFAYSTALDREAFEDWKDHHSYQFFNLPEGRQAQAVDMDLVMNFPSRWWGGRVAGLEEKKGSVVFGLLFEIQGQDWPVVQHKEGAVTGMCIEKKIKVLVDGKEIEAIAFTTAPDRASLLGSVSPRFIQALVNGATQAGLPSDYVERLKKIS